MTWMDSLVAHASDMMTYTEADMLRARGVVDTQIQDFRIGYLDGSLPILAYPPDFLEQFKQGKALTNVFLLPLTNALGEVKGLQFRSADRTRKGYSNYWPVKEEPVLFGLSQAVKAIWETESVFLVEGSFDLFPVQRFVPQTIPTLTNRVTVKLVRFLSRFVKKVWVGYDSDPKGQEGWEKFQRFHAKDFPSIQRVSFPRLPLADGSLSKDPSELWEIWGDDRLGVFLASQLQM